MEAIERSATTQAQIVDDLLDVARIVRGRLKLDVREADLGSAVEAAAETVRPAASAKGIGLEIDVEEGAGAVRGDPARLQQIVWNLLANAIKFTPAGGRVVGPGAGASPTRSGSRSATTVPASTRTSFPTSSSASGRAIPARPGPTEGWGLASPSCGTSWRRTAGA